MPNSLLKFRYNATRACDSCKHFKVRCKYSDKSLECNECIKRNNECTYSAQPKRRGPKHKKDSTNNDKAVQVDKLFRELSS
ncbi:2815_t:CDS:1, partial [Cetraspora pellucida]